ncbi:hypothetical protein LSM04_007103 [Trypanosoma melophagium]|uniref:uncharacterized protein n=1 Tax=Trypanosoma melophagium TaxID=715481 RepID=UPI00351A7C1B|nr:hypothetical protein LSM04_007103 [Trypanosoma melophagium]
MSVERRRFKHCGTARRLGSAVPEGMLTAALAGNTRRTSGPYKDRVYSFTVSFYLICAACVIFLVTSIMQCGA